MGMVRYVGHDAGPCLSEFMAIHLGEPSSGERCGQAGLNDGSFNGMEAVGELKAPKPGEGAGCVYISNRSGHRFQ